MNIPALILISGLPCTGKTSLGRRLAEDLSIPLVHKDRIKEDLFDTLGWSEERAWSKQLSVASCQILFGVAETILSANQSLMIEANFEPKDTSRRLNELLTRNCFRVFEINCVITPGDALLRRFRGRAQLGSRHPGHIDQIIYPELEQLVRQGDKGQISFNHRSVQIDTSDFNAINYPSLLQTLKRFLKSVSE